MAFFHKLKGSELSTRTEIRGRIAQYRLKEYLSGNALEHVWKTQERAHGQEEL